MKFPYQFIFYFFLALACSGSARANDICEADVINNCSCALPIMQSQLNTDEIGLLMQAWVIRIEPAQRQSDFFRRHSAMLLSVSERYSAIKYVIAMRCGQLAHNDE